MSVKYYKDGESIDISNIAIKGSSSTLPEYVQDGLFHYIDRDIGKIGSQSVIGKGLDFSSGYTFEVCGKITSVEKQYMRFLEYAPYGTDINSASVIAVRNHGYMDIAVNGTWYSTLVDSYAYPLNTIMTITLTADIPNGTAYIYINGTLVHTISNIITSTSGMSRGGWWYLGCGSVSDRVLDGNVYSGRYYNRILSATEMTVNRAVDVQRFT